MTTKQATPYAVICPEHGQVILATQQYDQQVFQLNDGTWLCPSCGEVSKFDDDYFARFFEGGGDPDRLGEFSPETTKWLGELLGATTTTLDGKIYANVKKGENLRLYIYGKDGYHSGGQWFTSTLPLKYPDEQIRKGEAHVATDVAVANHLEVVITNGGDETVFHSKNGILIYPPNMRFDQFWDLV